MEAIQPDGQHSGQLCWPDLIQGTLIKRYKRFLADVRLESGDVVTAHCANSGAMRQCAEPGRPVYLSIHDNPKRKLKYTWEIIAMPDSLVGVNTAVPNKLVAQSIIAGKVPELTGYNLLAREVKTGASRLDLCLTAADGRRCFIEVKNCTLVENGEALFPDAVTTRGRKHLLELQQLAADGHRCVMFYLIQRTDASVFKPADAIDPEYGKELRRAFANQVEILAYDVAITTQSIAVNQKLPFAL
jgi:sugar fermentation stimulation protein A